MWFFRKKVELPKGMADLHNHIVPGIDDGARDMEESLAMLRLFQETGFSTMVATSHLDHPMFSKVQPSMICEGVEQLKQRATQEGLSIELHPGAEVYYGDGLLEKVHTPACMTLAGGSYILIEFPPLDPMPHLKQLAFELSVRGVLPVLAHPERYEILLDRPQLAKDWVHAGWVLQLDLPSLIDANGKAVRKVAQTLLRQRLYGLAASDMHHPDPPEALRDSLEALVRYVGDDEAQRLMVDNPHRIIKGKGIIDFDD